MKKFIHKYRKQIFAYFTILMLLLSSITVCCAAGEDRNNVTYYYPQYPNYTQYDIYRPSGYGISTVLPFSDYRLMIQTINGSTYYDNFIPSLSLCRYHNNTYNTVDNDIIYNSNYNYQATTSVVTAGDFPYYDYSGYFRFSSGTKVNNLSFVATPNTWFVPYKSISNNRSVLFIRLSTADNFYNNGTFDVRVKGTYGFCGNVNRYTFDYTLTSSGGSFVLDYDDILSKSTLKDSLGYVPNDIDVPIYLQQLTVQVARVYIYDRELNLDIQIPIMSTHEGNLTYTSNSYVYMYAPENIEFNLDWILKGVNGFFNIELFGAVTLGGIGLTVVTCALAVSIMKILNHMK